LYDITEISHCFCIFSFFSITEM